MSPSPPARPHVLDVMRALFLALLLTLLGAAPALAGWSPPRAFDPVGQRCPGFGSAPAGCLSEPAPRVAVLADGRAAGTWVDVRDRVRASVADRTGHFGLARTLGRGLRPSVALTRDGTATVVWSGRGETLQYARRVRGGRFGRAHRLAAKSGKHGDDDARTAAQPDGSVLVLWEGSRALRTLTISPTGRPGRAHDLAPGSFDHDSTRVAPDGTIAACCVSPPVVKTPNEPPETDQRVLVHRPGGEWEQVSLAGVGDDAVETVWATRESLLLGTLDVRHGGDAGLLGLPSLARAATGAPVPAALRAPTRSPGSALAPHVTIDGSGRSVLAYQEKDSPAAFSRRAPVYVTVAPPGASRLPRRQRLDAQLGYEPAVRPLGPGAIAVWQAPKERWRVAVETDGRFRRVSAPRGPGPSGYGEDFNYAYDVQSAGRHAVLAWVSRDGAIRLSERSGR